LFFGFYSFYLEYVYYSRKEQAQQGYYHERPAPGVYSSRVQTGGSKGYGTIVPGGAPPHAAAPAPPAY
jgi:hypothetical protein